jgi:lycopene beta-cyclase
MNTKRAMFYRRKRLVKENRMERYAIIGGGLQGCLMALMLSSLRPDARVTLVERELALCGNHTWSFHASDLSPRLKRAVPGLAERHWPAYRVAFPNLQRVLHGGYGSCSATHLARLVQGRAAATGRIEIVLGKSAVQLSPREAILSDGTALPADLVVDARGPDRYEPAALGTAYQKFFGIEYTLDSPLKDSLPTLKDACVPQRDGYRFFYVLPLTPRRVLLEDTYFSRSARLDAAAVEAEILAYARNNGLELRDAVRRESGVIPLPLAARRHVPDDGVLHAGYGGGWFHPTTGYSFPVAARLAEFVATHPPDFLGTPAWRAFVAAHDRQFRYGAFLNRLLYGCFPPEQQWNVFERFYRLPEDLVARFYALSLTPADAARILIGRPPRGLSIRMALSGGGPQ